MRRDFLRLGRWSGTVVAVALMVSLGAGPARASGFSRRAEFDTNGVARLAFGASNVWKPVSVAVVFAETATRKVEILRGLDSMTYEITGVSGTGREFVYVFEGPFWFSGTNALIVTVQPVQAGSVEVICE